MVLVSHANPSGASTRRHPRVSAISAVRNY
jgi:hypothetical protein